MKLLDESRFDEAVKKGIVLVVFKSMRCQPCQALLRSLSNMNDYPIYVVDGNVQYSLAARFNVKRVPELIFFKDGKETSRLSGFQRLEVIENIFRDLRSSDDANL